MLWASARSGKTLRSFAPVLLFWFSSAGVKLTTTNLFLVFLKVGAVLLEVVMFWLLIWMENSRQIRLANQK